MKPDRIRKTVRKTLVGEASRILCVLGACAGMLSACAGEPGPAPQSASEPPREPPDAKYWKFRANLSTAELPAGITGFRMNLYRSADRENPDPATDRLVKSELFVPIDRNRPDIEFDAVMPEGEYYLETLPLDAAGERYHPCESYLSTFRVDQLQDLLGVLAFECEWSADDYSMFLFSVDAKECGADLPRTHSEPALAIEGCGETVIVVSPKPYQSIALLEEAFSDGPSPTSCVTFEAMDFGGISFESKPGLRYLLMVKPDDRDKAPSLVQIGCTR